MDKRDKILDAALKLFVEYGFHGTPTSKIASEAGVSNGTLFHYFKTKEELILELFDLAKNELNDFLLAKIDANTSLETRAKAVVGQSLYWAMAHPQKFYYIHQIYFSPFMAQIPVEKYQKYMQLHIDLVSEGQKAGIFKPIPMDFIITLVSNHIYGVYQYLQHNTSENMQSIIDKSIDMILDMVAI
jgi:AcrR family transcriptional regulator